jgi:RNA methyltransferase, TrmH family
VEEITSPYNPLIKLARSLHHRKYREQTGLFLAEGQDYALKAMAHGFKPHVLLIEAGAGERHTTIDLADWCAREGARVAAIPRASMQRISGLSNPQEVVLVCHARWHEPGEFHGEQILLALHEIRDPGNLGTIMRSSEATGVCRMVLLDDSCDPYAAETVRASAGSIFAMNIARISTNEFLDLARQWPGDVVGTHVAGAESFRQSYRRPVLLLMGSEARGLTPELARACTKLVRIPMAAGVESLNVAIATALMLYELELPHLPDAGQGLRAGDARKNSGG